MRKTSIDGISGCNYVPLQSGDRLYSKMGHLLECHQTIKNPFEKAMFLHNNLAYLQYFEDCNKRTARIMQFISLKNDGIMPLVLTQDHRELYTQYREALVHYYEQGHNLFLFYKIRIENEKDTISKSRTCHFTFGNHSRATN